MSEMRVLLIDDDRDDYLLTRELLAEVPGQPFELDWAADYDAGLQALGRRAHEVCLLDYRLGARNGLDLLREARAAGFHGTVIMLTGQREQDLDNAALLGGVAAFLKKERLDASQLDRAIRYALQQSRHAEGLEREVEQRTSELARANASLQLADRRKNEFIAILAHELRNPLAPITNALRILRMGGADANALNKAIEMMERQVAQMVRLVDDLLDVSRISSGKIGLRTGRVEVASIVHQAAEAARPLCESRQQELSIAPAGEPIFVDGDPVRLVQIIGNLLNNGCKFTPPGGRIGLEVEREGTQVVIRVRDNGVGIAADQLPRIFEMFAQVDSALERSSGGLGIGLTLVKTLVELHGGTIEARSDGLGCGSEFALRLPTLADVAETARPPPQPKPLAAASATARRVLVVDDNDDAARSTAMLLELDGHSVQVAHDGPAAIETAASWQPDVVLLDIGLPGMSGHEVAQHMRQRDPGRRMLLVAITGWGQDEDRRKSADAGFDAHMVKPLEPAALAKLLAERGR